MAFKTISIVLAAVVVHISLATPLEPQQTHLRDNRIVERADKPKLLRDNRILEGQDEPELLGVNRILGVGDKNDLLSDNRILGGVDEPELLSDNRILGGEDEPELLSDNRILGGEDENELLNDSRIVGGEDEPEVLSENRFVGGEDENELLNDNRIVGGEDEPEVLSENRFVGGEDEPEVLSDNRIVGGVDAEKGFAPHMVALVFGHSIISLTCGGSVVSRQHILTAAHCIVPFVSWHGELMDTLAAVVGSNQWNVRDNAKRFSGYINHPQYDSVFIKHDVGVLILREKLKLSALVAVIALKYDWVDGGVKSYATGFGRTSAWGPIADDLQVLHLKTITGQQCIDGVKKASEQWGWAPPVHPKVEICTFHSVNHGMCNGDSGSALVEKHSGMQIGIVSWGFACARGAPDMFARVGGHKHFLQPILNGHV